MPTSASVPGERIAPAPRAAAAELAEHYPQVRGVTEALCEPLEVEDYVIQSMPDASPIKWHLAHTTWFFETFVLSAVERDYRPFHPQFGVLFNSYYEAVGARWPRPKRGLLSRPTVDEVFAYRAFVDERVERLLADGATPDLERVIELGLHHEQQHQELMLTDLKHAWSGNPLQPQYRPVEVDEALAPRCTWLDYPGGLTEIGHEGSGFAYDNEGPRHRVYLQPFQLASRLTTNAEFLAFVEDGGYERPEFWLSDGWRVCQSEAWTSPRYWSRDSGGSWSQYSLAGRRALVADEPVCHVSYYEADAFARWAGARLPTEAEWESAAVAQPLTGHFAESRRYHPAVVPSPDDRGSLQQLVGDVWQWTSSPYVGYPGYRPPTGALGEYNGKFMCNQFVLRGASCATPRSHARFTYRNFFPPDARWQFSGLRLAQDAS